MVNRDPQNTKLAEMQNEIQVNSIANRLKSTVFGWLSLRKKHVMCLIKVCRGDGRGKRKGLGNFRLPVLVLIRWVNNQDDRF